MPGKGCSRGHRDNPVLACPACLLIAEGNGDRLEMLRREVREYCAAYTSRGMHAEGMALAKLKKAAEG